MNRSPLLVGAAAWLMPMLLMAALASAATVSHRPTPTPSPPVSSSSSRRPSPGWSDTLSSLSDAFDSASQDIHASLTDVVHQMQQELTQEQAANNQTSPATAMPTEEVMSLTGTAAALDPAATPPIEGTVSTSTAAAEPTTTTACIAAQSCTEIVAALSTAETALTTALLSNADDWYWRRDSSLSAISQAIIASQVAQLAQHMHTRAHLHRLPDETGARSESAGRHWGRDRAARCSHRIPRGNRARCGQRNVDIACESTPVHVLQLSDRSSNSGEMKIKISEASCFRMLLRALLLVRIR